MSYSTGASEQVLQYIKQKIRSGEWAPGNRIPTEEQLCAQLDVSRIAVRQAIEKLASVSVLTKRQGSGTYVNESGDASIVGLTCYPVTEKRVRMVLEFRRMFDPYNAQLFIQHAAPGELEELEKNFADMIEAGNAGNEARFHNLDSEFHAIIARGTHNAVIVQMCELLTELLVYYQAEQGRAPGFEHASRYHRLILEAIRERDAECAFIYCRNHIDTSLRMLDATDLPAPADPAISSQGQEVNAQ